MMPSKRTTNYQLSQWEPDDKVLRTDFNADNDKIDKALKALDTGKASASSLNSLTSTVNGKASQSELDALKSTVTSLQSTVSQKQNTASAVKIATGSYTGNGKSGQANAKTLNFTSTLGKLPQLLVIRGTEDLPDLLVLVQGVKTALINSTTTGTGILITVSWNSSNNTVTWYGSNDIAHFNRSGSEYRWFALA